MIKNHVVKIEAYDTTDESMLVYTLETFDEDCATLKMDTLVSIDMIDDLCSAIRQGVEMLELNRSEEC